MEILHSIQDLRNHLEQTVVLEGTVSQIMWQHLIAPHTEYPIVNYLDLASQEQTVVYTKSPLPLNAQLRITGNVIAVTGGSKRPDRTGETKMDALYCEYHLIGQSWQMV